MRRLVVNLGTEPARLDETIADAKAAADAGVHMITVGEERSGDPFATLAILARETERILLATSVANIWSRTPAALAQHFATLDDVSGGRVVIGLGAASAPLVERLYGTPFKRPLRRMREYADVIRLLIAGQPVEYDGEVLSLGGGLTLQRERPARTRIPVFVGAIGPRSVAQTAAVADGWLSERAPRPRWRSEIEGFRVAAREAGRDPDELEIVGWGGATVTERPDRAYTQLRRGVAYFMARGTELHQRRFARLGLEDELRTVREAWDRGGSTAGAAALPERTAREFAHAGSVEGATEWLDAQLDAGFTIVPVTVEEPDPHKREATLRRLVG